MLFNFQGPNLLRCIEVFHRNSLFIIACRFEFVKLFFQDFFEPLWLSLSKFPDWLTVWVPIGPLWCAALRQLNYNTTPLPFCQHLFCPFFDFFWKKWIFLKNSKRAAKLLCFHRSFAYWWLWLLNCVWVGIFNLVRFKAAGGQIGPILHVPPVVGILHADNQVIIK